MSTKTGRFFGGLPRGLFGGFSSVIAGLFRLAVVDFFVVAWLSACLLDVFLLCGFKGDPVLLSSS